MTNPVSATDFCISEEMLTEDNFRELNLIVARLARSRTPVTPEDFERFRAIITKFAQKDNSHDVAIRRLFPLLHSIPH